MSRQRSIDAYSKTQNGSGICKVYGTCHASVIGRRSPGRTVHRCRCTPGGSSIRQRCTDSRLRTATSVFGTYSRSTAIAAKRQGQSRRTRSSRHHTLSPRSSSVRSSTLAATTSQRQSTSAMYPRQSGLAAVSASCGVVNYGFLRGMGKLVP